MKSRLTLGIDATNLRQGGGRTHIIELLRVAQPEQYDIERIVVWGSKATLNLLEDRAWLIKVNPPALEAGLWRRSLWQRFDLAKAARIERCDVLFVPGGSYAGNFHPVVTMSRNMLPFEWSELRRYGLSSMSLKLLLLRFIQGKSFSHSEGVIFLTQYAQREVEKVTGVLKGVVTVISHGMNIRFSQPPREQPPIAAYDSERPYRILYVSIIDQYKHQWQVVEAVARLRKQTGWPIQLDLVGPAYTPAMRLLNAAIAQWDPNCDWVKYHGAIPYDQLHTKYQEADLGLFASSCENMPNILIETMAAGLPIACSNRGPNPEVLGEGGVYFDPESPKQIAEALEQLILDPELRRQKAEFGFEQVQQYSWKRCADETFGFLAKIAIENESVKN